MQASLGDLGQQQKINCSKKILIGSAMLIFILEAKILGHILPDIKTRLIYWRADFSEIGEEMTFLYIQWFFSTGNLLNSDSRR